MLVLLGIVVAVVGYLLAQRDARQADQIKDLYDKHTKDADRLNDLELEIARNHYPKAEVTALFTEFKSYLNERFDRIEQAVGVERRGAKL